MSEGRDPKCWELLDCGDKKRSLALATHCVHDPKYLALRPMDSYSKRIKRHSIKAGRV